MHSRFVKGPDIEYEGFEEQKLVAIEYEFL